MGAQLDMFIAIWRASDRRSQISGAYLGADMCAWMFSHVLPKSTYPAGKCDPENIVMMTLDEHMAWEHRQSKLVDKEKWHWVFELKERLKKKYNGVC